MSSRKMANNDNLPPMPIGNSDNDSAEKQKKLLRFWTLVAGLMFFFGCHNYMQELIMRLPGFKVGVFLGYLEVLGVAICSYFERRYQGEITRKAPWSSYFFLCLCLLISSATSNFALNYINYPTKVVFRSCKLVPTMIIAQFYNNKVVHWFEYTFGCIISLGMSRSICHCAYNVLIMSTQRIYILYNIHTI